MVLYRMPYLILNERSQEEKIRAITDKLKAQKKTVEIDSTCHTRCQFQLLTGNYQIIIIIIGPQVFQCVPR